MNKSNMSPQQLQEFNDMKKRLAALERVENVAFIENIERRLNRGIRLNDLIDVDVPSPANGQPLEYTTVGTPRWIAGTDNT